MKRDMELVRQLLLYIEGQSKNSVQPLKNVRVDGYTSEQISHHTWLLMDAGFIEGLNVSHTTKIGFWPKCLTWVGEEFLATVRREEIWRETLDVAKRGGSESLSAIFDIAKALVQKRLEKLLELDK